MEIKGLQWGRSSKAPENCPAIYRPRPRRIASMGPELKSSGKPGDRDRAQQNATICFNGAGAQKLRKTIRRGIKYGVFIELQWGRSSKAPENTRQRLQPLPGQIASMGPELKSSGKTLNSSCHHHSTYWLQWGRSSKAPENWDIF